MRSQARAWERGSLSEKEKQKRDCAQLVMFYLFFGRMSASCHGLSWAGWARCWGGRSIIAFCAGALLLAGSPQLREHIRHHAARPSHSVPCAIIARNAGQFVRAVESSIRPVVGRAPIVFAPAPRLRLTPVWVPTLFLEAYRYEHGPP